MSLPVIITTFRASFTEIMNFGFSIDTVLCSIIDPQGIPDELFYAAFHYDYRRKTQNVAAIKIGRAHV